ncbi:MAG TPA: FtsW/RodA/SpoVE family cell cycle protein, partial [Limnochordia bacterium]
MSLNRRLLRNLDPTVLSCVVLLTLIGFVSVMSATQGMLPDGADPYYYVKRQLVWVIVGVALGTAVLCVDYRTLGKFARPIYAAVLLLLAAVLFAGPRILGAERWLILGPVRVQPSEIAKIGIILTLSKHLARKEDLTRLSALLSPFLHVALPMGLILLQPDLGTALVFTGIV